MARITSRIVPWAIRSISRSIFRSEGAMPCAKAEIKNDICEEINRLNGVAGQIKAPGIDISSWQSIFNSLRECGEWAIVENENEEIFHIGIILKAGKNKLTMREFDADGKWQEETKIPYKEITSVSFKTRYIDNWRKYLERTKEG